MNKKLFISRILFATVELLIATILFYLFIVTVGEFLDGKSFIAFLYFIGSTASAVLAYYIFMIGLYEAAKEKGNMKMAKRIRKLI